MQYIIGTQGMTKNTQCAMFQQRMKWTREKSEPFRKIRATTTRELFGERMNAVKLYNKFLLCATYNKWRMQLIQGELSEHFEPSAIKIQALVRGNNARWRTPCFTWKD